MKAHAVKENTFLKSIDFVIIVLTLSFFTFIVLKSTISFPEYTNHSGMGVSLKSEFHAITEQGTGTKENKAQETTITNADRSDVVVDEWKALNAETKKRTLKSNSTTAVKRGIRSEAAKADQPAESAVKSKDTENAPVVVPQKEKSVLENWIKNRDDWEQK